MKNVLINTTQFKDTKKELPTTKNRELTVEVYFICNKTLYKGEYHTNRQFYAYQSGGSFDCFASRDGSYKTWGGKGDNQICSHWCYVEELKITLN